MGPNMPIYGCKYAYLWVQMCLFVGANIHVYNPFMLALGVVAPTALLYSGLRTIFIPPCHFKLYLYRVEYFMVEDIKVLFSAHEWPLSQP